MNVSELYINWLRSKESFRSKAYKDGLVGGVQMFSIGYGHQIQPNEQYLRTATLTVAQAEKIFRADVKIRVDYVNSKIKKSISQSQFDTCVDLCFNAGVGAFGNEVAPKINAGDSALSISTYIKTWRITSGGVINAGLIARRLETSNWYIGAGVGSLLSKITSFTFLLFALVCGGLAFIYYG